MKIAVLGAGNVGGSLARAAAQCGHEVALGVRDPNSDKVQKTLESASQGGLVVRVMDIAEAVAISEVVALTIPWPAAEAVLISIADWGGKVLIDATNRFGANGAGSVAEDVARLAKGARVVKAFNTIGAEHYLNPVFRDERASMLIAGDDADAKRLVMQLAEEFGFEPVDAGSLANSVMLDQLARLWVSLMRGESAIRGGMGRDFAFRIIKR